MTRGTKDHSSQDLGSVLGRLKALKAADGEQIRKCRRHCDFTVLGWATVRPKLILCHLDGVFSEKKSIIWGRGKKRDSGNHLHRTVPEDPVSQDGRVPTERLRAGRDG